MEIRHIAIKEKRKRDRLLKIVFMKKMSLFLEQKYEKFTIFLYPNLHPNLQFILCYFNSKYGKESTYCYGCSENVVKDTSKQKIFKDNLGENITITLCDDCLKEC